MACLPEEQVTAKAARNLLEAFSRYPHGDGIREERRERNARFAEKAVPKEVAVALSRLMIWNGRRGIGKGNNARPSCENDIAFPRIVSTAFSDG